MLVRRTAVPRPMAACAHQQIRRGMPTVPAAVLMLRGCHRFRLNLGLGLTGKSRALFRLGCRALLLHFITHLFVTRFPIRRGI